MGDEEEVEEDKSLKAENILKKLQAEAEAKRSGKLDKRLNDSLSKSKNDDSSAELFKDDKEFHKDRHEKGFGKTEIDEDNDDPDVSKLKHKKRKHSEALPEEDFESERTDIKGNKKKKKKKHKEKDGLSDNLDSSDIHDGEILGVSQSTDDLSPKKKRKKDRKKDGQTELETLSDGDGMDRSERKKDTHKKKKKTERTVGDNSENEDEENEVTNDEMNEEADELPGDADTPSGEKSGEIGGFTVIGSYKKTKVEKVKYQVFLYMYMVHYDQEFLIRSVLKEYKSYNCIEKKSICEKNWIRTKNCVYLFKWRCSETYEFSEQAQG